jgi:hypothetical protein
MESADIVWGGVLVTATAVEVYGLFNKKAGDTLSERTRVWFRVHTKLGRGLFAVGWVAFSAWFFVHILE